MPYEIVDLYADAPEGANLSKYLEEQGWEEFLTVGSDVSVMYVKTFRRRKGTRWQYAAHVGDINAFSEDIVTDSLIELMDLLARWAPAVQSAAVVALVDEVSGKGLSQYGDVEMLAARWAWGQSSVLPRMRQEAQEAEAERARARQARRG